MRRHKILFTRRQFLAGTGTTAASFLIVPRHVVAASGQTPPNEKINVACIGVGGRGEASVNGVAGENIVALCDVDQQHLAKPAEKHPGARRFQDFRKMFDEMDKSIDAVTVATPDHTHAVAAMAAIQRGKHVYCEKPLAHSIFEVRALMQAARQRNVVTQLGNQGHSSDTIRSFCEWIRDGAIGRVHSVHAVCGSNYSRIGELPSLAEKHPVPSSLDWDAWLGPAQARPYHPAYLPGKWRGWMPFGCGVIGDWVCHVVDPVFWALDLGAPTTVQAQAEGYDPRKHASTFPAGTIVTYEFPAKGQRGPVKLVWFDGREKPPRPAELENDEKVPGTGAIVMGDKGSILYGSHGAGGLHLIPQAKMDVYQKPAKSLPRVKGHHEDWLQAIKKHTRAGSNFEYGGPLTEIALLGVIATRLLGQKLQWDGANMLFTNSRDANQHLKPVYRTGWTL